MFLLGWITLVGSLFYYSITVSRSILGISSNLHCNAPYYTLVAGLAVARAGGQSEAALLLPPPLRDRGCLGSSEEIRRAALPRPSPGIGGPLAGPLPLRGPV